MQKPDENKLAWDEYLADNGEPPRVPTTDDIAAKTLPSHGVVPLVDLVWMLGGLSPILTVGVPHRVVVAGLVRLVFLILLLPLAKLKSSRSTNGLSSNALVVPTVSSDRMP